MPFKVSEIKVLTYLIRPCIAQTAFSFQGNIYNLSVAIDFPFSSTVILRHVFVKTYMMTCMIYFENILFESILKKHAFAFLRRYINEKFTLIDVSLQNVGHILQIMDSIYIYIQFTHEVENNGVLPFLGALVSRINEGFSTSVFRKKKVFPYNHMIVFAIFLDKKLPHFTFF